jgi:RNA polymerase sigma-70 factor, ECF subfamily
VTDEGSGDPAGIAATADSLSMSFLVLLERLTPVERAVFLLHDVFDYDFEEVGRIVKRTPANCRQQAVRARRFLAENRPRFEVDEREADELVARFFAAANRGDVDSLIEVLAEDVIVHGDGGGKVPQWYRPIEGADSVARLFARMGAQMQALGATLELHRINGQPGVIFRGPRGGVFSVMSVEVVGGRVATIRSVVNPDKLGHLGPIESLRDLMEASATARS